MVRGILLLLVPAAFAAAGAWMWLQGGRYEETENAYVKANMIVVTPGSSSAGGVNQGAGTFNRIAFARGRFFAYVEAPGFRIISSAEAQAIEARVRRLAEQLDAAMRGW